MTAPTQARTCPIAIVTESTKDECYEQSVSRGVKPSRMKQKVLGGVRPLLIGILNLEKERINSLVSKATCRYALTHNGNNV